MNEKCVYVWVNNTTNEPFYVGCGSLTRARSAHKSRSKAFEAIAANNKCHCIIVKDNLSVDEAAALERQVIQDYREQGCNLVNQTNGGEIGHIGKWTNEMKQEYAERLRGSNNPNYDNHWTEKQKKHLSELKIKKGLSKGGRNGRAKPVMCVETGKVFACKRDAGTFLGVADACGSIYYCLKDPKRVAGKGKYHFVSEEMFDKLNTEEKRKEWLENIAS